MSTSLKKLSELEQKLQVFEKSQSQQNAQLNEVKICLSQLKQLVSTPEKAPPSQDMKNAIAKMAIEIGNLSTLVS